MHPRARFDVVEAEFHVPLMGRPGATARRPKYRSRQRVLRPVDRGPAIRIVVMHRVVYSAALPPSPWPVPLPGRALLAPADFVAPVGFLAAVAVLVPDFPLTRDPPTVDFGDDGSALVSVETAESVASEL